MSFKKWHFWHFFVKHRFFRFDAFQQGAVVNKKFIDFNSFLPADLNPIEQV